MKRVGQTNFQIGIKVNHFQRVAFERRLAAQLRGRQFFLHLADALHRIVNPTAAVTGQIIIHAGAHGAINLIGQHAQQLVQNKIIVAQKLPELRLIISRQRRMQEGIF